MSWPFIKRIRGGARVGVLQVCGSQGLAAKEVMVGAPRGRVGSLRRPRSAARDSESERVRLRAAGSVATTRRRRGWPRCGAVLVRSVHKRCCRPGLGVGGHRLLGLGGRRMCFGRSETSPEKWSPCASTPACFCTELAWGRTAMRKLAPLMVVRGVGSHRPPPLLVSSGRKGSLRASWIHARKQSLSQ
jgi:hypothetical protein